VLLLCVGCSEPYLGIKIPFTATWGDTGIACEDTDVRLSDLRFYLSSVQLLDQAGNTQAVELHADIPWQQPDLALIDLENGEGPCTGGTADTYAYLVGGVPPGDYAGLRFTVGVPFDRNHANPLTADAPLDDPAMHWHWRSGYKFVRAGVATANDGFWIHVGSAGCEGTVRNISGCQFPNRVIVELDGFVPNDDVVAIDLKALFDGSDFDDGLPGDCSSGRSESACSAPFAALGIDFATGDLTGQQRVFSIHR
jgi:uncharacterized repeat protein (TIGR04052 family)